jgi:hypothetical protein
MMNALDLAGYVIAGLTVLILAVTLGAPLARQRLLVVRMRRDLKTIDTAVVSWARDRRDHRDH